MSIEYGIHPSKTYGNTLKCMKIYEFDEDINREGTRQGYADMSLCDFFLSPTFTIKFLQDAIHYTTNFVFFSLACT